MDSQSYLQTLLPKPSSMAAGRAAIPPTLAVNVTSFGVAPPKSQSAPPAKTPWNPAQFELWVERGVVWDLKQMQILGFIDYSSIHEYFRPTKFTANSSMFTGSPFSLKDFPVYGFLGAYYSALIFTALHMINLIPTAWELFRSQGLTNGTTAPPPTAGPVATAKEMGLFRANSPLGTKSFSAAYVAYMYQVHPKLKPWWPPS